MSSSGAHADHEAGYVLGHSADEVNRLTAQARFLEPITRRFFDAAGLSAGMRVLDIGCGAGDVSFLAAELVGPSGEVVGIDASPQAIPLARERAQQQAIANVTFDELDLTNLTFDREFDAVVGRLVLMYVQDPVAALRQLATFVRPGGLMAFHEADLAGLASYPPVPLYDRCCHWITELFARSGDDWRMGIRLHQCFISAGLPAPTMRMEHVLGGADAGAALIDQVAGACVAWAPEFERLGIATLEEIGVDTLADRLPQDVAAHESVVVGFGQVGAWVRID